MLARTFASYRLHMAGITQNKQKCLMFIVVPQGRKKVSQIRSKWRKRKKKKKKKTMKKKLTWKNQSISKSKWKHSSGINNNKNNR